MESCSDFQKLQQIMGAHLAEVSVTLTAQLFAYTKHDKTSPAKKSIVGKNWPSNTKKDFVQMTQKAPVQVVPLGLGWNRILGGPPFSPLAWLLYIYYIYIYYFFFLEV